MYRRLAGELGLAKGAEPSIPFGEQHVGVVEPRVTVTVDTPLPVTDPIIAGWAAY
jgi:hypothetical protein